MDVVRVYDVASGKWYSQQTSGEIPSPRNNFCGVVATAKDNSSYNVYIHGGQTGGTPAGTDDVYILTVPTFQWVKAYQGNETARAYHSCEIINKQQMLVIGGFNATEIGPQACAQEMGGDLRTFDMSESTTGQYALHIILLGGWLLTSFQRQPQFQRIRHQESQLRGSRRPPGCNRWECGRCGNKDRTKPRLDRSSIRNRFQ